MELNLIIDRLRKRFRMSKRKKNVAELFDWSVLYKFFDKIFKTHNFFFKIFLKCVFWTNFDKFGEHGDLETADRFS